jgi:hypothetical protein
MTNGLAVTADPTNARMQLDLTWSYTSATISRYDPDNVWRFVRNAHPGTVTAGHWIGADYEAPLDAEVFYYVRDAATPTPTTPITSGMYTLSGNGATWLRHLTTPALSQVVHPVQPPDVTRKAIGAMFAILGRSDPIATTMARQAGNGQLILRTDTTAERLSLVRLLSDGSVLQLACPGGYGIGSLYIQPNDFTEQRISPYAPELTREYTLDFAVVAQPL